MGKYIVCDADAFWKITSAPYTTIEAFLKTAPQKYFKIEIGDNGGLRAVSPDSYSTIVFPNNNSLGLSVGDELILCSNSSFKEFHKKYHLKPRNAENTSVTPSADTTQDLVKAPEILEAAVIVQTERGQEYDQGNEERNIGRVVSAFNAIHGTALTEAQGWHFMALLKAVRLFSTDTFHTDSAVDLVSYSSLVGEAKSKEKANG